MDLSTRNEVFDIDAFARAIEASDGDALVVMYDDAAEIDLVNVNAPPARPHRLRGRQEIAAYVTDVCGRAMTHAIERRVQQGDTGAYVERCTYPDGVAVLAASVFETRQGRIVRQTTVEAWDS